MLTPADEMDETDYLMSDPKSREILLNAIYNYETGKDKRCNHQSRSDIDELLSDISVSPYIGIGKPEPLKHELNGLWSRRIDQKKTELYIESMPLATVMYLW